MKPLMLGMGQSKGAVEVRFAEGVEKTSDVAVVRATLETADGEVTAKANVELVGL